MIPVFVILLLHIALCVHIFYVKKKDKILRSQNIMPFVCAVPFFGAVCFSICAWKGKNHLLGNLDSDMKQKDILKGRYQRIEVDEDADIQVVPLEDALLVNDAKVRHSLMLDILHKNPNEYIGILQKARNSDDAEVTHYATTMMMEILTEYEKRLQEYDQEYHKSMQGERLREYILYLQEFIGTGLVSGSIERLYRERLRDLLKSYFAISKKAGKMIFISIENYLWLGDVQMASEQLQLAGKEYPQDERMFMLYGEYFDQIRDYQSMKKMIAYMKSHHIYLSREGREWFSFWDETNR